MKNLMIIIIFSVCISLITAISVNLILYDGFPQSRETLSHLTEKEKENFKFYENDYLMYNQTIPSTYGFKQNGTHYMIKLGYRDVPKLEWLVGETPNEVQQLLIDKNFDPETTSQIIFHHDKKISDWNGGKTKWSNLD